MKRARKWLRHPILIAGIVFAVLPFILPRIGSTTSLATEIAIYALYGLGFNLLLGYTGLVSFGASAFLARQAMPRASPCFTCSTTCTCRSSSAL